MKLFQKSASLTQLHYGKAFHHAAATPLASLLINLELAQEHRQLAKSPYVKQALNGAYRLKELFNLPQQTTQSKSFPIKYFLTEAINLVKNDFPQVVISQQLHFPEDLTLQGNRFYFQEAVICVLKNAIESYAALGEKQHKTVAVIGRVTEKNFCLSFIDGGRGLNWLEKSLVFAEGYTQKKDGLGIGLTWVKRIVKDHFGGKIKLISHKNRGTTMSWNLPLL